MDERSVYEGILVPMGGYWCLWEDIGVYEGILVSIYRRILVSMGEYLCPGEDIGVNGRIFVYMGADGRT